MQTMKQTLLHPKGLGRWDSRGRISRFGINVGPVEIAIVANLSQRHRWQQHMSFLLNARKPLTTMDSRCKESPTTG